VKASLGLDAYSVRPRRPGKRARSRTGKGRLRRFLPLDADISERSTADLRALAAQMNATPHKCLGFMTPAEAFAALLLKCRMSPEAPSPWRSDFRIGFNFGPRPGW